jgi:CBS domain-containing protein
VKVKDIMTTEVYTLKKDATLKDAVLKLRKAGVSGMPVLDADKVIGVFSEEDLLNQLPDILNESDKIPMIDVQELTSTKIEYVMGKPPIVCSPEDEIRDIAKIFLEKYIHRLPVVDKDNNLVGVVSLGDVLKAFIS